MKSKRQKDPVAQSTSARFTISAVDFADRNNKETLVVKEEETYDADAYEKSKRKWCSYWRSHITVCSEGSVFSFFF